VTSVSRPQHPILIGTSGYSYADWKGPFYPAGLSDREMLSFYARRFPAVEINYTYYRMPSARTMAAIVAKAPGLSFAVKLTGSITHEGKLSSREADQFRDGVAPMAEAGVLGCLLAQFPWSFKYSPAALEFLARVAERLADFNLVAEFREAGWAADEVYEALKDLGFGFCNVDEPRLRGLMPPTDTLTSGIAYYRFHGRNAKTWWKHGEASERYDYLYSKQELQEWVPKIKKTAAQADKTYVFLNNHPLGQAITNARMLMEMLGVNLDDGGEAALF
jgi:uncharacterized protein YecE (DUF72 family)